MPPLPPLETNPTQPVSVADSAETVAPSAAPLPPAPTAAAAALKDVSLTYAAINHWLTAAFAIPLIGGAAFVLLVLPPLSRVLPEGSFTMLAILSAVGIGLTWMGVWYSARFIGRSYRVADPVALANRATLVTALVGGVWRVYALFGANLQNILINLTGFAVSLAVFYLASRRYLKKNV
jgi:hypothetical protein